MAFQSPGSSALAMELPAAELKSKPVPGCLERKTSRSKSSLENGAAGCLIHALGHDHLVLILERLSIRSVLSFALTCKQGRELACCDAVWGSLCRREWGLQTTEMEPIVERVQGGWKEIFRQLTTLQSAHWQQLQMGEQGPCRRASHSLLVADGKLVAIAGGCDGGRDLDDTWIADPSALIQHPDNPPPLTWHLASTGEVPGRFGQCSVAVPERHTVVIFGGINDRGLRLDDTWAFDDVAGSGECTWRKLDLLQSPLPRGAPGACYGGGQKVVLFGGLAQDNARYADTWVLDFELEPLSWRKLEIESGPQARSGHTMTWLGDGRIVLFGGRNMVFEMLNDVWVLNMDAAGGPKWHEIWAPKRFPGDEAPVARSGHTATAVLGGKVIMIGGEDMSRNRKEDVWLLDPDAGAAPEKWGGSAMRSLNGSEDNPEDGPFSLLEDPIEAGSSQDVVAVVPEAPVRAPRKVWQRLQVAGPGPSRRSFHTATRLAGSSILVFGGMVDGELVPGQAGGLKFDDELWLLNLVA